MKKNHPRKGTALVVAIGLLAVLSAMAFTYVTVMKIEMEVSVAQEASTQTALLDQWALQSVVDKLLREPMEGAIFTPVDWAGEEWYTAPLIEDSPFMPDKQDDDLNPPFVSSGTVMCFAVSLPGKGEFTIVARVLDCSSMVNLADAEEIEEITDDWRDRKMRLLQYLPFNTKKPKSMLGEDGAKKILSIARTLEEGGTLPTKEALLAYLMESSVIKTLASQGGERTPEEMVALSFLGERGFGGDVVRVGFKDFITLNSYVDDRMLDTRLDDPQPRAPININTAPSWLLKGLLAGIQSKGELYAPIPEEEAKDLADYIIAYRTPKKYLPDDLQTKQDKLVEWITHFTEGAAPGPSPASDPFTKEDLGAQLYRLAHLLINPVPAAQPRLPRPFATWAQFDAFLKLLVYNGKLGSTETPGANDSIPGRKTARAIMANCNPNTNHSDQPIRNGIVQWNCGKDQLTTATTEFCFGSFGRFEIEMIVGRMRQLAGGGKPNADNFPSLNEFSHSSMQTDKFRTMQGSIYAPDRLSFYKGADLWMTRSIKKAVSDTKISLGQDVSPLDWTKDDRLSTITREVTRWRIERLEATKKWNAIVKFADVARFDTVADFLGCANADRSGTGSNALYYPMVQKKKTQSNSDLYDSTLSQAEKDGSISMRTEELQGNSPHFQD
ncbi:MAG: hypothetical protein HQ592_11495, partial [Planctomycetes bacterium]|nr:hypothetical protein [Planctomycetota bacterium]